MTDTNTTALKARSPLMGYDEQLGDLRVREITDQLLISLAIDHEDASAESALAATLKELCNLDLPALGNMSGRLDADFACLGMQRGQWLLSGQFSEAQRQEVITALSASAYVTDQSDAWVRLDVSGPGCVLALERICPLDLDGSVFPPGRVARTVMEHLSVIIVSVTSDHMQLLSPASSAESFLHAVTTSIHHVS